MTISYSSSASITLSPRYRYEHETRTVAESRWTFGFVDLAGFTALTDAHGDREAVTLVDRFETVVAESLTADDQLVKTIGDAVMLRFATPATAVAGARRIFARCTSGTGFPAPRAGLHHGPAVARGQDWFGATVNVAARVAAHSRGGQLLATRNVAETARRAGTRVAALGTVHLRNVVAPVELYDLDVGAQIGGMVIDPVCRMQVASGDVAGTVHHQGRKYSFCSTGCIAQFVAQPGRYAADK
ncbi:pH-sensitive adenylate cyclase [Mycobacterium marinum]|uniref:YHS domain-containing protein n=1 Tax=Mycobacterium marinum TaxID=1781 RepID=UPI000E3C0853|nr:YHS domain-containing protein [Mycobacterium marinum]RFZ21386.1 pH-sensitive adenylate cyclase [Mycobacterium marinum]